MRQIEKIHSNKIVETHNRKSSTINEQILKKKRKEWAPTTSSKVTQELSHPNASKCNQGNSLAIAKFDATGAKMKNEANSSIASLASMIQHQRVVLEAQNKIIIKLQS